MKIKEVSAKSILDSRKEKTILVSIKTNVGDFSASSPSGKSTGKFEAKTYKKSLEEDIKTMEKFSEYFSDDNLEKFDDLKRVEDVVDGHVGANTLFALESAILKAIAKEQKIEIWELINKNAKKTPRLVGNCVGGGVHSHGKRKPDFQEFLLIPKGSVKEQWGKNRKIKRDVEFSLKRIDDKFEEDKNDEDAWETSLNEKEVFDVLKEFDSDNIGTDVASSTFYRRKKYHYGNPLLTRTKEEQMDYLSNLIKNFNLFYIEDPFEQEDFESFSKLLKKFPNSLIVGDDLTTTNPKRLEKAIKMKSINAIIVKPNQIGYLTEVKTVCEMARKNNIKLVFSHRSGETEESILADLAFGFGADFFKCGITGKEREIKIKRLVEIEKGLK